MYKKITLEFERGFDIESLIPSVQRDFADYPAQMIEIAHQGASRLLHFPVLIEKRAINYPKEMIEKWYGFPGYSQEGYISISDIDQEIASFATQYLKSQNENRIK